MSISGLSYDYSSKIESEKTSEQLKNNIYNTVGGDNNNVYPDKSGSTLVASTHTDSVENNEEYLLKNNKNIISTNSQNEKKSDENIHNYKDIDNSTYKNNEKADRSIYANMHNQSDYVLYNENGKTGKCFSNENTLEDEKKKKNWKGRTFSRFTSGGVRSSTVLFICTALGVGFLSIPYAFSKLGIVLSLILILINSIESYVTTNVLCLSSLEHNTFIYGDLLKKIGKGYHKVTINIGLSFGFFSIYIIILILMSDFLSSIFLICNFPSIFCNTTFIIVIVCIIILPITFQNKVGAYGYFLVFSLVSVAITIIIIGVQTPTYFNLLKDKNIVLFNIDRNFFKCFNILLFSFSQHPNACFITGQFYQPTERRIKKSIFRSILLQVVFYTSLGLLGYLSFLNTLKDNIVLNYENSNIYVLFCKILLCITFFLCVPLNFMGSYPSILYIYLGIGKIFYRIYLFIFRRNTNAINLPLVSREYLNDPLEGSVLDNFTEISSVYSSPENAKKERVFISVITTIICATLAINVRNGSTVIGIGGGITSTIIACYLPGLIYYERRHKVKNKFKRYAFICVIFFFSFMGFFSAIMTTIYLFI